MENSRLYTLIRALSRREIRELHTFLVIPANNKRQEVSRLFDILAAQIGKKKPKVQKEQIFQKIKGPDYSYDDQQVRLWMSFLLKAIEKYLLQVAFLNDPVKCKIKLTEIYRKRNLPKHLEYHYRELEQLQEKRIHRNADYYQDDFQIQFEHIRVASAQSRSATLNLQSMSNHLDIAFIAQKLRQSCLAISHQSVFKIEYDFGLLEMIILYIEKRELFKLPTIAVYYFGYKILTQPEQTDYFLKFKTELVSHSEKFPEDELGDLYILGINYCIKKYNAGDRQFLEEEFELYQEGLKQNILLKNNQLSRYTYRNIVTLALVLEAFGWVEKFIYEYKDKLDAKHQESTFSLSLAQLEYSRKNYDAALQLLQKSNYKEVLLNLAAKTVMLKIFYELEEFDLLDAHLRAMRIFIRRKKMIAYHEENYVNLIRFTRKLIEGNAFDKKERAALKQEILETKVVAEKDWLTGRI